MSPKELREPSLEEIAGIYQEAKTRIDRAPRERKFWERVAERYLRGIKVDDSGTKVKELGGWKEESKDHEALLINLLQNSIGIIELYDKGELTEAIETAWMGHDKEMAAHYGYQALRMIGERVEEVGQYPAWELLTAVVLHNIGRFLGHGDEIHQYSGGYLVAKVTKELFEKDMERKKLLSKLIGRTAGFFSALTRKEFFQKMPDEKETILLRVVRHIVDHTRANSGDVIGDLVKACDRLQQTAPLHPGRSILYDIGSTMESFFPPIKEERRKMVYFDEKNSSMLCWLEFYTRNLYPFFAEVNQRSPELFQEIMEANQKEGDRRRALSVAALMIASDYQLDKPAAEQNKLAQQVFAPELGLAPKDRHRTKRELPSEVWKNGERVYQEWLDDFEKRGGDKIFADKPKEEQLELYLRAVSSYVGENPLVVIKRRFNELKSQEKDRVLGMLDFCLKEYAEEIKNEVDLSQKLMDSSDRSIAMVAGYVHTYVARKLRPGSFLRELQVKWSHG